MSMQGHIDPLIAYNVQRVLPAVYDDSLSYYELLCRVQAKLNEVVGGYNSLYDAMVALQAAWVEYRDDLTRQWEEYSDDLTGQWEEFRDGGYLDSFNVFVAQWFADNQEMIDQFLEDGFSGELEQMRRDATDTFVPFPVPPESKLGDVGQVLSTQADGTTKWSDPVVPSDEQAASVITTWLNDHPEATTTVQDNAVTPAKLSDGSLSYFQSVKGFYISGNASTNEKTAYRHIIASRITGDPSAFSTYRLGILVNTSQYPHNFRLIDVNGGIHNLSYSSSTKLNKLTEGNSTIEVLYDWDAVDSQLMNSATYNSLHVCCGSAQTVWDRQTDELAAAVTRVEDELSSAIDDVDEQIEDVSRKTKIYDMNPVQYTKFAGGWCRISGSNVDLVTSTAGYGYRGYPVTNGVTYRVHCDGARVYTDPNNGVGEIMFSAEPLDEASLSLTNVIRRSPAYDGQIVVTDYYDFDYEPTADGYLWVYLQNPGQDGSLAGVDAYSTSYEYVVDYLRDLSLEVGKPNSQVPAIVCSGSSITWGDGYLDSSMVAYVDRYVHERLMETIMHSNLDLPSPTVKSNTQFYGGSAALIVGQGTSFEFDITGDEVVICHAKRRSSDYGVMTVTADGVTIGTFDNRNPQGHATETFTGTALRTIELSHNCTYNHAIYVNDSATPIEDVVINRGGYGGTASGDAFVYRKSTEYGGTVHAIQFAASLGTITSVRVEYDYGRMVAYEYSTQGQTNTEYQNESTYGNGTVSYDPDNPSGSFSSGLEFRCVDPDAFFVHKFTSVAMRHIVVTITDGSNPYLLLNYVGNRYFDLMNAGIGGWRIDLVATPNYGINKFTQFGKCAKPVIVFQESETNDDWSYSLRRIGRSIGNVTISELRTLKWLEVRNVAYDSGTDLYAVTMATGIISSITPVSLTSADIVGTQTQVGDIVRIGTYHGDIADVTCRRITSVDLATGTIGWDEPIHVETLNNISSVSDLVGKEINIRNLDDYKTDYETFISNMAAVYGGCTIIVVDNGLPDLWCRQLWGYDVVHRELAAEHPNVLYLDARKYLRDGQFQTVTGTRSETVTNTGASTYELDFDYSRHAYWQGFKVLVNGVDVYGRDAYVEGTYSYYLNEDVSGANANKANAYVRNRASTRKNGKMRLKFFQNVPSNDEEIVVQFADNLWSTDYTHPASFGSYLYGLAYESMVERVV